MTSSSRNWVFTLNNYTEQDIQDIKDCEALTYLVFGFEIGESGTPHLQGFCIHEKKTSLGVMKKIIPKAHWEMARGTAVQAAAYCKKDGNFHEQGVQPLPAGESKKRQWDEITDLARAGKFSDLIDRYPSMYLRYYKGLKAMRYECAACVESAPVMDNYWYTGHSGSGKSRTARERYPGAYIKMANKWWDDYAGEDVVIIEDWSPDHAYLVNDLKLWTDHHSCRVEAKYGSMVVRPKTIIITSQYSIEECFNRVRDSDAIVRRFKVVNF